ncbi:uncharacterized protein LOC129809989 isoform X2 [Phlebotomus papatasi]|uniref:uncharacterized protein LOC129809989 isoform X2 n=1 Tax=Phlebotomus papatasi TaxID=29031 RepID=UPI002483E90E|nr:uncharacterized protein LOC129809989 isoform X2 [Phlebotomus papatasi]
MDKDCIYKKSKKLIRIVQKYPCLYDVNNKGYNNPAVRNQMWQKVSKEFGAPTKKCREKWDELFTRYEEYYLRLECQKTCLIRKKKLKRNQVRLVKDMRHFKPHIRLHEAKMNLLRNPNLSNEERQAIKNFTPISRELSPDIEELRCPPSDSDTEQPFEMNQSTENPLIPIHNIQRQTFQPVFEELNHQQVAPIQNSQPAFQRPNFEPAFERPNFRPAFQMPYPQQIYGVQNYRPAMQDPTICRPYRPPYFQPVFKTQSTQRLTPPSQTTSYQPNSTPSGTQCSNTNRQQGYNNERNSVLDVKQEHEKAVDYFFADLSQQIIKSGMSQEKFTEIQTIIVETLAAKLPEYNQ